MVNKNFPTSILLIDDNENVLNSLGDLLQESNFAVSKANSDTKAFEILEKCEKYPSFVLVDQVLQDGAESGLKVVKDIRDYRPDIFIVMYTANSLIEDQQKWQAMYAGAHRYIRKFSPKELLRDVSDFIRDMRELQELTQKFKELTNERTAMASALIGLDVGTALIDREFRIWFANQQQSEIFGMSDIIGAPCWKYLYNHPVEQGPCSGCIVKATFETQTPRTRDILVKVSSGN